MTPTIALLAVLLAASPCPAGQTQLTYDHGLKDVRTTCFKTRGKTIRGKRQGRWTFTATVDNRGGDPLTVVGHYRAGKRHGLWVATVKKEDGGCEVQEYLYLKVASGRYSNGLKHGRWRFELGAIHRNRVHRATYRNGRLLSVKRWILR